jgi:hypothetical protein
MCLHAAHNAMFANSDQTYCHPVLILGYAQQPAVLLLLLLLINMIASLSMVAGGRCCAY